MRLSPASQSQRKKKLNDFSFIANKLSAVIVIKYNHDPLARLQASSNASLQQQRKMVSSHCA